MHAGLVDTDFGSEIYYPYQQEYFVRRPQPLTV